MKARDAIVAISRASIILVESPRDTASCGPLAEPLGR